jgi:hypothetical protein
MPQKSATPESIKVSRVREFRNVSRTLFFSTCLFMSCGLILEQYKENGGHHCHENEAWRRPVVSRSKLIKSLRQNSTSESVLK